MKKEIHPKYVDATITCACGAVIHTRSTKPEIKVGVCSQCHPFFTGTQKFVDTAGRVEKFMKKYAKVKQEKKVRRAKAAEKAAAEAEKAVESPAEDNVPEGKTAAVADARVRESAPPAPSVGESPAESGEADAAPPADEAPAAPSPAAPDEKAAAAPDDEMPPPTAGEESPDAAGGNVAAEAPNKQD